MYKKILFGDFDNSICNWGTLNKYFISLINHFLLYPMSRIYAIHVNVVGSRTIKIYIK